MYYTYIIRCCDNTLYTGITTDIARRIKEHSSKTGKGAKYTRTHSIKKLEALWTSENRANASKLEYKIKQLKRTEKLKLIEEPQNVNSLFDDDNMFTPVDIKLVLQK